MSTRITQVIEIRPAPAIAEVLAEKVNNYIVCFINLKYIRTIVCQFSLLLNRWVQNNIPEAAFGCRVVRQRLCFMLCSIQRKKEVLENVDLGKLLHFIFLMKSKILG